MRKNVQQILYMFDHLDFFFKITCHKEKKLIQLINDSEFSTFLLFCCCFILMADLDWLRIFLQVRMYVWKKYIFAAKLWQTVIICKRCNKRHMVLLPWMQYGINSDIIKSGHFISFENKTADTYRMIVKV